MGERKLFLACLRHPSFETRHMRERCGTEALIGSICVLGMMRLMLAVAAQNLIHAESLVVSKGWR